MTSLSNTAKDKTSKQQACAFGASLFSFIRIISRRLPTGPRLFSSGLGSMWASHFGGLIEIAFKTEIFLPPDYGSNTQNSNEKVKTDLTGFLKINIKNMQKVSNCEKEAKKISKFEITKDILKIQ